MLEEENTYVKNLPLDFKPVETSFSDKKEIDTSSPPEELYPPTKREYYYSEKTPSVIIYSISNKLLEQIETFELNKMGL